MNEKLSSFIKNPIFAPVVVGIVAFIAGAEFGYYRGCKTKEIAKDHEILMQQHFSAEELADLRDIKERQKEVIFEGTESLEPFIASSDAIKITPEEAFILEHLSDVMVADMPDEPVRQTLFDGVDDIWDYDEEVKTRTYDTPYIIHKDEFWANEREFSQTTLTYYAGDDIMVDEEDAPVYNHSMVVGPLNFGHGSGDQNVFHVRNERLKAEYEILFDKGLYSVEVLGLEIENNERVKGLKHSGLKKFKME